MNSSKPIHMDFIFDNYCIVTRADQYGDTGSPADAGKVTPTFSPNTSARILPLHTTETMDESLTRPWQPVRAFIPLARQVSAPRPKSNNPFKGN